MDRDRTLRDARRANKGVVRRGEQFVPIMGSNTIWHQIVESAGEGDPNRLIVILNSRGCSFAIKDVGPCFNCGLVTASGNGELISTAETERQLDDVLALYDFDAQNITELDLFNAGSLLDDWQVPPETRAMLFGKVAGIARIREVLIDSRPEDVEAEKLAVIMQAMGTRRLWVGIGFETADDGIRELCVNKGFLRSDFEHAARILGASGAGVFPYLMLKPAFLTEREAVEDACETIRYLTEFAVEEGFPLRISLEPGVVQGDCLLTRLYEKGLYSVPWLWSVVEVVERTWDVARGRLRIGVPEEVPKLLDRRRNYAPDGGTCPCSEQLEHRLVAYNKSGRPEAFADLPKCECRDRWRAQLERDRSTSERPLRERVEEILGLQAAPSSHPLMSPRV